MSTYPLDEPHLEALRWACAMPSDLHGHALSMYERGTLALANSEACALRALSSPASAASLVRDLLARADVEDVVALSDDDDPNKCTADIAIWWDGDRVIVDCVSDGPVGAELPMPDVPRLISALAALAPGDREGAMRALREVGR